MRFRGVGRVLMAVGVVCMIVYILIALNGESANALKVGRALFYVGLCALIAGLSVRLFRQRA
ncbi:MAG: hypothetical protein JO360_05235 [Acidobacteria bacterium]|nr:hypothetical protein [Acidobacteriota bacterium]